MERQVLVPLDGSALAEQALPHALVLARATGSAVILLQAVPPPILALSMMLSALHAPTLALDQWAAEQAEARAYLTALADRLETPDLVIRTVVIAGDAATAIVGWADQDPPQRVIAMTTHGRSGVSRWVFGSVAEKVLQAAPVPLLVVRATPEAPGSLRPARAYQTIVVPLDGSRLAEHALDQAVPLAAFTGADLHLVGVVVPPHAAGSAPPEPGAVPDEAALAPMHDYLTRTAEGWLVPPYRVVAHVLQGAPAESILGLSEAAGADLIIMSTHGRGGLQRLWLGSVALKVTRGAACPVLLVRA